MTIEISPDIRRMARGTAFERDGDFLVALATAVAELGAGAHRNDVIMRASEDRIRQLQEEAASARADGRADGTKAERQRISAILTSREAEGRREVAEELAFRSELPANAAIAALRVAPKKSATFSSTPTPAPADLPFMRSADAPGGLVTSDMVSPRETEGEALVSTEPMRPASASSAKSMWASVVAGLNREQAQPQQTTK